MAIMRVTPPPTTVRTGTRCPDAGASDTRGRRSGTPRLQIPQPDQVIGGGGEGELPIHQGDAAMPELAQAADGLHPAEDLFHEFSFPLTHVIARMPRGPTVDRTPADLLRHVGRVSAPTEIDEAGGVIQLAPARSKTLVGRILPISPPIADALARRRARRDPASPLVFHRDGIPVRRWRTAWRTACQAAGVPTRFLHDCRRTAARNLIRANVPERVAMLLTGHKSRAIFDRYNIIHEQELLDAGDQLVAYLAWP